MAATVFAFVGMAAAGKGTWVTSLEDAGGATGATAGTLAVAALAGTTAAGVLLTALAAGVVLTARSWLL